jgi:dynein heavy chain
MNKKLEGIQKSLEAYLEMKRGVFPRFYFISNDDLLEILGQSKTPTAVQSHLKKLFDNIKTLEIKKEVCMANLVFSKSGTGAVMAVIVW